MNVTSERVEKLARSVPSLPEVVNRVDQEMRKADSSPQSIEAILGKDTSLAAKLLRISNSAMYGFSMKVETISQAVTMVGMGQLRELVLGTSVVRLFKGIDSEVVDMESFWKHSVGCGICAKQIAEAVGEKNAESFFVAGLIHDLGRLVMLKNLPLKAMEAVKLAKAEGVGIIKAEREVLDFDHAELGQHMLQNWKVPARISEAVGSHHLPGANVVYEEEATILHLADVVVECMGIGKSGEEVITPQFPDGYAYFSNDREKMEELMEVVDETLDQVVGAFIH